jgi:SAM-dependent methyltransferase
MTESLRSPEDIWRDYDADEQRLSAPLSERMLDLAQLQPGMQVLDLASGRGEPAIRAAKRVAPGGRVLGVDVAAGMLQMARERAQREGVANLDLRTLDAETLLGVPKSHFDACLARWGLMYFQNPVAALTAARLAVRPHARLVAAFWAEPARVNYDSLPREALAKHMALQPLDPEAPGTFRFGTLAQIERDFAAAGWALTHVEECDVAVMQANTDAELIAWTRAFGFGRMLQNASSQVQQSWAQELIARAAPLRRDGIIQLGGISRIVVAQPSRQVGSG